MRFDGVGDGGGRVVSLDVMTGGVGHPACFPAARRRLWPSGGTPPGRRATPPWLSGGTSLAVGRRLWLPGGAVAGGRRARWRLPPARTVGEGGRQRRGWGK